MTSEQQNPKRTTSAAPLPEEIDKTPPPADEPIIDRPAQLRAEEAARLGRLDGSEIVGAEVAAHSDHMASGQPPTAGDPDVLSEQAKVVGEEAIGGTTPTPDQSNVDEIAAAAGIETQAEHPVGVTRDLHKRDEHRHELDPESKGPGASS
jgi:hypothetical protein